MREIKTLKAALEKAKLVEVEIIRSLRDDSIKTTYREILCSKCSEVSKIQDQTFSRWAKTNIKYCAGCHGATKGISDVLRVTRLNEELPSLYSQKLEVIEYLGYRAEKQHSYCTVQFKECSHCKEYCCVTLRQIVKQGKALKCDECAILNKSSKSSMEVWSEELIPTSFETQVPYSCIAHTTRKWIADFYDKESQTIIEVTTEGQGRKHMYSSNIYEKRLWCAQNNINFIVADNIHKLEDIVRALGRPKESTL